MTDVGGMAAAADVLTDGRRPVPDAAAAHLAADEVHGRCANCETSLTGPFCHACGQKAHLHSRLRDLLHEAVEGIAHFDGRLWRTLPLLALSPGRLSREWRAGRRVRYVAPLHLFLFAVFLFFTCVTLTGQHIVHLPSAGAVQNQRTIAPGAVVTRSPASPGGGQTRISVDESTRPGRIVGQMLRERLRNPEYYSYKAESLLYKLSFMLVPISMLILAALMMFKRGYAFYDHGVVSLYGVGFLALVATALLLTTAAMGAFGFRLSSWTSPVIFFGLSVHAISHLKGAYALSRRGAIIRGLLLGVFSLIGFSLFVVGVIALGLFA